MSIFVLCPGDGLDLGRPWGGKSHCVAVRQTELGTMREPGEIDTKQGPARRRNTLSWRPVRLAHQSVHLLLTAFITTAAPC